MWKCTLCYDRLKGGHEPACAKACPTDSIQFGEVDELRERAERAAREARGGAAGTARGSTATTRTTAWAASARSSCSSTSRRSTASRPTRSCPPGTCRSCGGRLRSPPRPVFARHRGARSSGAGDDASRPTTAARSSRSPSGSGRSRWYFFTGGIGGASSVLHGLARLTGNTPARAGRASTSARRRTRSPRSCSIKDLGRPERFLNMFRVFKVTSPMSVGSWILARLGRRLEHGRGARADRSAAAGEVGGGGRVVRERPAARDLHRRRCSRTRRTRCGREARDDLPWLFGASAVGERGRGGDDLHARPCCGTGPACRDRRRRRVELAPVAADGASARLRRRGLRAGRGRPVRTRSRKGSALRAGRSSRGAASAAGPRRSRAARSSSQARLRFAGRCSGPGFQSARDPRYTVQPQKERLGRQ